MDPDGMSFDQKVDFFEDASGSTEPLSTRRRLIGELAICALGAPVATDTVINYVATKDVGERVVYDTRTGLPLDPDQVRAGRRTELANMEKRELYERVHTEDARGKRVRSMWLDEARMTDGVPSVRSRCVAMEFNQYDRNDTYAGNPPLKFVKIVISRVASKRQQDSTEWTRALGLYDVVTAFWHADLPDDEPIAVIPPKGEEEDGWLWQMKAMCGTRRASILFLEFMVDVMGKCGYKALKVGRQLFYSEGFDSLAVLHGDDIMAEAGSKGLDHLDQGLRQMTEIKILHRVGPRACPMGRYLKRFICYVPGVGYEWHEDPKHAAQLLESRGEGQREATRKSLQQGCWTV